MASSDQTDGPEDTPPAQDPTAENGVVQTEEGRSQAETSNESNEEGHKEDGTKTRREFLVGELKSFYGGNLERIGLLVFAITALALIVLIVLTGLSFAFFPNEIDAYPAFRFAELLLKVAATGLVIALVGRAQNAFVLAFGILLIGALIVPSKDLVQMALIASGSNDEYQGSGSQPRGGVDLAGRSSDVASKIVLDLENQGLMPVGQLKEALPIITRRLTEEQEITLVEQIVSRGALSALQNVGNNLDQWMYRYGQNEEFIADLRFLRSESLISYAYDDISSAVVTPLGERVLQRVVTREALVHAGSPDGPSPGGALGTDDCPLDIEQIQDVTTRAMSGDGFSVNLESEPKFFQIQPAGSGTYLITLDADGSADPILELIDMYPDSANYCFSIAYNDDSNRNSTTFDSLIESELVTGRPYVLALSSFMDYSGPARLRITPQE